MDDELKNRIKRKILPCLEVFSLIEIPTVDDIETCMDAIITIIEEELL